MYNINNENPPKPPVITSLASALHQIDIWQKQNQFDRFTDLEGMYWDVRVNVSQVAHDADPKKLIWKLRIEVSSNATAKDLIDTGIFDVESDARMISMIGDKAVPLVMKPVCYQANSEDEARQIIANALPRLKASFPKNSLEDIKRSLVGRWIDEQNVFGVEKD